MLSFGETTIEAERLIAFSLFLFSRLPHFVSSVVQHFAWPLFQEIPPQRFEPLEHRFRCLIGAEQAAVGVEVGVGVAGMQPGDRADKGFGDRKRYPTRSPFGLG